MAQAQLTSLQVVSANSREIAGTRLAGPWRYVARVLWLALVLPCVAVFAISLPSYYQQLQGSCADFTYCPINPILPGHEHALLNFILTVTFAAIWCGIGFFVFWRRS